MQHIWIIGDEFLDSAANSLRKLKNQYIFDASKPQLGIFNNFHVEAFHDSEVKPTYKNILRKVRNNLTVALNKFPLILPVYLVVVLNNNIIHDAAFVDIELKTILKRVFNDIDRLLTTRKEQIQPKYRSNWVQPEVFITRPLPKPASALTVDKKFKSSRRQVNTMLDELIRTCNFKILNIDTINCSQRALFEEGGQLSDFGKEQFWSFISNFLETRFKTTLATINKCHTIPASKEDIVTAISGANDDKLRNERSIDEHKQYREVYRRPDYEQRDRQRNNRTYRESHFDEYHTQFDRGGRNNQRRDERDTYAEDRF